MGVVQIDSKSKRLDVNVYWVLPRRFLDFYFTEDLLSRTSLRLRPKSNFKLKPTNSVPKLSKECEVSIM